MREKDRERDSLSNERRYIYRYLENMYTVPAF